MDNFTIGVKLWSHVITNGLYLVKSNPFRNSSSEPSVSIEKYSIFAEAEIYFRMSVRVIVSTT